jgi:peptidyl-prolyl cis-trans isomerase A (cyclophilin A)
MRALQTAHTSSLTLRNHHCMKSQGLMHWLLLIGVLLLSSRAILAGTQVNLKTSLGLIVIDLHDKQAPISTQNFLGYVRSGFYDDTLFHRVIPNFMIQGGGYNKGYRRKKVKGAISNEAANGLENKRGSLQWLVQTKKIAPPRSFSSTLSTTAFLIMTKKITMTATPFLGKL